MRTLVRWASCVCGVALACCGGQSYEEEYRPAEVARDVQRTIVEFVKRDPGLHVLFAEADGFVVIPMGDGSGTAIGELYENSPRPGLLAGYCRVERPTSDRSAYSEVVFLKASALRRLKREGLSVDEGLVALEAGPGSSVRAEWNRDALLFVSTSGAATRGQRLRFVSVGRTPESDR